MRRKGESVKTIARTLGVSIGSVSLWCQSIKLTEVQKERLLKSQIAAGHKGRLLGADVNRQKRLQAIGEADVWGREKISTLSERDRYMLGLGLYWGEGAKSRTDPATVTNSDPAIVLFAKQWMEECLGVGKEEFRPYIYISRGHQYREKEILKFWSKLLKIPEIQLHRVILKGKPKKFYENHDSYYGVCALRVRRGTILKYRILGLIKACKDAAGVVQRLERGTHKP